MLVQCSWCKKMMGAKESETWSETWMDKAHSVTHSICASCYQAVSKNISHLALGKNPINKSNNR